MTSPNGISEHYKGKGKRRRIPENCKIPREVLKPAVELFKLERTYGMDQWTDLDIGQMRMNLPEKYRAVPVDDIRHQMLRGRKENKTKKKPTPEWYKKYLQSPWWQKRRKEILDFWGGKCMLNREHEAEPDPHHNRYRDEQGITVLGRETIKDVIPLCRSCHKRHERHLLSIPDEKPI